MANQKTITMSMMSIPIEKSLYEHLLKESRLRMDFDTSLTVNKILWEYFTDPQPEKEKEKIMDTKNNKDRNAICEIISEMLDNPDDHGIYPTSTCFTRLEHYIQKVRMEAIGWGHTHACIVLEQGKDPRTIDFPEWIERAEHDLKK